MKSKIFSSAIAVVSAVATTACKMPEYKYCNGLNETNMPARVVLVENSRDATRYVVNGVDSRIASDSVLVGDNLLVAYGDELTFNYVSCQNIDGFEDVTSFAIGEVRRHMTLRGDTMICDSLGFRAESELGDISLGDADCTICPNAFYDMAATSVTIPRMLISKHYASSYVSVSPVFGSRFVGQTHRLPLNDDVLYAQETIDGSPPVIVARVWSFDNTPETAEARAYLGIESDEDTLYCGDLYYGYFSR